MNANEQLVLDLPTRAALGRDDFIITPCNAMAVQVLDDWKGWPGGKLVLCGPSSSGKTHLSHVWAHEVGARILNAADLSDVPIADGPLVIEDADKIATNAKAQTALFHLYNSATSAGHAMLITGENAPSRWDISLPDLASRLGSLMLAQLDPPDDPLLGAMLEKLFKDRQLVVSPALIRYLVPRMGRTYADVVKLVAQLDKAAMAQKRSLTVKFAAKYLNEE